MMVLNMCCRFGMFSSLSKLGNFGMEGFALKEKKRKKQKKLQPGNRNVEAFWGFATRVAHQLSLSQSALIGCLSIVRRNTNITINLIYWYEATLPKQC